MSLTARVLIGLVAGLACGVMLPSDSAVGATASAVAEPIGSLFINAIRMTVIPLVASSLIVGVATNAGEAAVGRLGGRALGLAVALLLAGAAFAAVLAPPLLGWLGVDPSTAAALRSGTPQGGSTVAGSGDLPSATDWLIGLIPSNPVAAAADGAMLPVIVFSLLFGMALAHVDTETGAPVVRVFQGVAAATLRLVEWVLRFAPLGVFGLALPLAARLGVAAAGALAYYVAIGAILTVLFFGFVVYPLVAVAGGISLGRFIVEIAPAQAVALSSRSSLASLPAMIEAAKTLRLSDPVTGCLVPLGAAVFRLGSAVGQTVGVLFAATLYGVSPDPGQLATIVLVVALTTFTIPGVPGGSIVVMVPILQAAGLPVEGIGLLLGVDTIPDMVRTTANVTGTMAVMTVVGRGRLAAPVGRTVPTTD